MPLRMETDTPDQGVPKCSPQSKVSPPQGLNWPGSFFLWKTKMELRRAHTFNMAPVIKSSLIQYQIKLLNLRDLSVYMALHPIFLSHQPSTI